MGSQSCPGCPAVRRSARPSSAWGSGSSSVPPKTGLSSVSALHSWRNCYTMQEINNRYLYKYKIGQIKKKCVSDSLTFPIPIFFCTVINLSGFLLTKILHVDLNDKISKWILNTYEDPIFQSGIGNTIFIYSVLIA